MWAHFSNTKQCKLIQDTDECRKELDSMQTTCKEDKSIKKLGALRSGAQQEEAGSLKASHCKGPEAAQ